MLAFLIFLAVGVLIAAAWYIMFPTNNNFFADAMRQRRFSRIFKRINHGGDQR